MSSVVGHNTEAMRNWSGNIENSAKEFDDSIKELYSMVDNFVSSDFVGGLSKDYENAILDQRATFNSVPQTLNECADLIKKTSNNIDADEEALKASISSGNLF